MSQYEIAVARIVSPRTANDLDANERAIVRVYQQSKACALECASRIVELREQNETWEG